MYTKGDNLKNLGRKELQEEVFDEILKQIQDGIWKPGEKIPSETELSLQMGVSRISVREVIQRLKTMDLLESFRGKGTFVKELKFNSGTYLKSFAPLILLDKKDIIYIVEFRKILENGIIELYMENVTPDDIAELEHDVQEMSNNIENLEEYMKYDLSFHLKLYQMTKNPVIEMLSGTFRDMTSFSMDNTLTKKGAKEGVYYSQRILKAIKEGDSSRLQFFVSEMFDRILEELRGVNE